jgi:hypothetical protein
MKAPILLLLTGLSMTTARAAEPETLTLACQGTLTTADTVTAEENAKPQSISMGIIINFTTRTVQGFDSPDLSLAWGHPVKITGVNEVTIAFGGSGGRHTIMGSIDRMTGAVGATSMLYGNAEILSSTIYSLQCKPTQRMF